MNTADPPKNHLKRFSRYGVFCSRTVDVQNSTLKIAAQK